MKLDFVSEFDIKFCNRYSCKNNWIIKQKPILDTIDIIITDDYNWEKTTDDYKGYGITNQISKQYFQQMRIVAKNTNDYDLKWYSNYCLRAFNQRFRNQKEVDEYFGRT